MAVLFETREEWLDAAVDAMRPVWLERARIVVPEVRVGVGFPSGGLRSKALGQCWTKASAADGVNEITIRVTVVDPEAVLAVLGHELVHASTDCKGGHGKRFASKMRTLGFEGDMRATYAGASLAQELSVLAVALGDYPGADGLAVAAAAKTQGTRMVKCECEDCGFLFRTTTKWIKISGLDMRCPDATCTGIVRFT